jgi:tight adherence protein B
MTGAAVALLLMVAVAVLARPGRMTRVGEAAGPGPTRAVRRPRDVLTVPGRLRAWLHRPRGGSADPDELPMFVRQMAGLLRAGRSPSVLWTDLDRIYAEEDTTFAEEARPVIAAAGRSSALGLSVPAALRDALGPAVRGSRAAAITGVDRLWVDLAGCLEVAERSGAPLAALLDHYATQLEADLAGRAARETALAGPRATVVLLTWLPVVGLLLGFALGADPVEVLLGHPLGRAALCSGALLMVVSRAWSGRLVRRAGSAR